MFNDVGFLHQRYIHPNPPSTLKSVKGVLLSISFS